MKRPKRPLTAYNLFFRFKREKILGAHKSGDDSAEAINRLIEATPGLEDQPDYPKTMSPKEVNERRRKDIRAAMEENIAPKCNRHRSHRKTHGALSFLEMNKKMVNSWKSIDGFTRTVFEELADEGRMLYRKLIAEYEEEHPPPPKKKAKISSSALTPESVPSKENGGVSVTPERSAASKAQSSEVAIGNTTQSSAQPSLVTPVTPSTPQMSHSEMFHHDNRGPMQQFTPVARSVFPVTPSSMGMSSPGYHNQGPQMWGHQPFPGAYDHTNDPRFFYHRQPSMYNGNYGYNPPRRISDYPDTPTAMASMTTSMTRRIESLTNDCMMPLPVYSDNFNTKKLPPSRGATNNNAPMDPFPDISEVASISSANNSFNGDAFGDDFDNMPICDVDEKDMKRCEIGEVSVEDFMGLISSQEEKGTFKCLISAQEEKGGEFNELIAKFGEVDDFMESNARLDHQNVTA